MEFTDQLFVLPAEGLVESARAWVAARRSPLAPFPEPRRRARPRDVDVLRSLALWSQADSLSVQIVHGSAFVGTDAAPGPAGSAQWCAWHLSRAIEEYEHDPAKIAAAYGTARAVVALFPLSAIGLKVQNGGRRGALLAAAASAERLERRAGLLALDSRMSRGAKLSQRARATAIARATGMTPEAVRAQLRRAAKKVGQALPTPH